MQPTDEKTRPLRDLVKESIFNLIDHSKKIDSKIENSNILDLFSGCGGFSYGFQQAGFHVVLGVDNSEISLTSPESESSSKLSNDLVMRL